MPKYRYHAAIPDALASGQPVYIGSVVDLDADAVQANAALIASGRLVEQAEPATEAPAATTKRKGTHS